MYKIYKVIDKNDNVIYVGRTKMDFKKRFYVGWKWLGIDKNEVSIEIIEETEDVSRERYWIEYYSQFGTLLNKNKGDGLDHKEYSKEYYEINKDKIKEYYEINKEKRKQYYELNKDIKKEYGKEYYEINKDKIKEYYEINKDKRKDYYELNKDIMKEYRKEYYELNKEIIKQKRREKYQKDKLKKIENKE